MSNILIKGKISNFVSEKANLSYYQHNKQIEITLKESSNKFDLIPFASNMMEQWDITKYLEKIASPFILCL